MPETSNSREWKRLARSAAVIELVAKPHAGIDMMVSAAQAVGNVYIQMRWTVFRAKEGSFSLLMLLSSGALLDGPGESTATVVS